MLPNIIQPWGKPFTPLLPSALIKVIGDQPVPKSLRRVFGSDATLEVLNEEMWETSVHNGKLWDIVDSIDRTCLWQIADTARSALLSHGDLPIRSGEPLVVPIENLPFSTRIRNAALGNLNIVSSPDLTFSDVLNINSFGYLSTIEFACVLEAAIGHHPNLNTLSNVIQPWGKPPTPLLPKALVKEVGDSSVPKFMHDILSPNATLSLFGGGLWELSILNERLWELIQSIDKKYMKQLIDTVHPILSNYQKQRQLIIRSGEALNTPIEDLPFSMRVHNIVTANLDIFSSPTLTFYDVLHSVDSFGERSAIEFACILEAAFEQTNMSEREASPIDIIVNRQHASKITDSISKADEYYIGSMLDGLRDTFQALAAYARDIKGADILADVMPTAREDWPYYIKNLWMKLGEVEIQKLVGDATRHYSASEAISHIFESIDDRTREVIIHRTLATGNPLSLQSLGDRQGVTRERIRQMESKAVSYLRKNLNRPEFGSITQRSEILRQQLGTGIPVDDLLIEDSLNNAISDLGDISDIDLNFIKPLLLWLAGPYKVQQGWLLAKEDLYDSTLSSLLDHKDEHGVISKEDIHRVLENFGIKSSYHFDWIGHLKYFHAVEEGFIYLRGSITEKAHTLIKYHRHPLTAGEILDAIGKGTIQSIRQRLIEDLGFWRINKQGQFVIANTPGYDEYTNIVDEIVQEIQNSGGQALFDHLVEKISHTYGVKPNSIVLYLNTPMFKRDNNNFISIRETDDDIDVPTDISKSAACYQSPDGFWYWRVHIDKRLARGSGCPIPNAFAKILGCSIGSKIQLESECEPLTISWPLSSTIGASVGSLRQVLRHYEVGIGDYLFIIATKPRVSFKHLKKDSLDTANSDFIRLNLLLGCDYPNNDDEGIIQVASALGISNTPEKNLYVESRRLLHSRREIDLAEMIPSPSLSIDEYISKMQLLFDR